MDGTVEEATQEEDESVGDSNIVEESVIVDFQFTMAKERNYDDNSILIDTGSNSQ